MEKPCREEQRAQEPGRAQGQEGVLETWTQLSDARKSCFWGGRQVPHTPPELLSLSPSPGPFVPSGGPGDSRRHENYLKLGTPGPALGLMPLRSPS